MKALSLTLLKIPAVIKGSGPCLGTADSIAAANNIIQFEMEIVCLTDLSIRDECYNGQDWNQSIFDENFNNQTIINDHVFIWEPTALPHHGRQMIVLAWRGRAGWRSGGTRGGREEEMVQEGRECCWCEDGGSVFLFNLAGWVERCCRLASPYVNSASSGPAVRSRGTWEDTVNECVWEKVRKVRCVSDRQTVCDVRQLCDLLFHNRAVIKHCWLSQKHTHRPTNEPNLSFQTLTHTLGGWVGQKHDLSFR